MRAFPRPIWRAAPSDRARSPALTSARKFSRFYSNYPANSAIAVTGAHAADVNICSAPSRGRSSVTNVTETAIAEGEKPERRTCKKRAAPSFVRRFRGLIFSAGGGVLARIARDYRGPLIKMSGKSCVRAVISFQTQARISSASWPRNVQTATRHLLPLCFARHLCRGGRGVRTSRPDGDRSRRATTSGGTRTDTRSQFSNERNTATRSRARRYYPPGTLPPVVSARFSNTLGRIDEKVRRAPEGKRKKKKSTYDDSKTRGNLEEFPDNSKHGTFETIGHVGPLQRCVPPFFSLVHLTHCLNTANHFRLFTISLAVLIVERKSDKALQPAFRAAR